MKIILLHGDNWPKISQRLTKFIDVAKARGYRIERIDLDGNLNFEEKLSGTSLFKEEKLFIIDNVKLLKKKDCEWLKKNSKRLDGNLVIACPSILTKTFISSLPNPDKIESYEIPKKIWLFFDSIYPGNFKFALNLLHEVIETEAPELIYALLGRHLKDLYITLVMPSALGYQPWRIKKLTGQANKFSKNKLKEFINSLALSDYLSKTGESDLVSELDLIIAARLQ